MYIWQRLAYPHRKPITDCVRSLSSRKWRRCPNKPAVTSPAAVDGLPKSTSGIVASLSKKSESAARSRKNNHLHADLSTASLQIDKYSKAQIRKCVAKDEFRKVASVSQVRAERHDIVGKKQSGKTGALAKKQSRKTGVLDTIRVEKHDIVGKKQSRKIDAVSKVRIRKNDTVGKDQFRKIGAVPKIRIRKHDIVSKGQLPKTGAVNKVQIRRHRVVDFEPGKPEVASAASIKNIVEDESLKKAHSLDHTRIDLASHCATARILDHTLQPRTDLMPDDEYLQRSPILHDVPPDGKSSHIEVSPDACEASLSFDSTNPIGHVSSRRSGLAPFVTKSKRIRRKRVRKVIMRRLVLGSNQFITCTDPVGRFCQSPEEGNVIFTNRQVSLASSSIMLVREREREQVSSVISRAQPEMIAVTGREGTVSMRRKRRKITTKVIRRNRQSPSSELINDSDSIVRKYRGPAPKKRNTNRPTRLAAASLSKIRAVIFSSKFLYRMRAVGSSSKSAPISKIQSLQIQSGTIPSPRLQARETRQNENTHAGIDGIEPTITKYIFNDEKKCKQDALTEKVLAGLDDLLYTYNKLQLRKPRGKTRDNAVEWPSRRKYTRWQRVDTTGQPLGEAHEDRCAAETAESDIQDNRQAHRFRVSAAS